MRFSSAFFRKVAGAQLKFLIPNPSGFSTEELIALHAPGGELWNDLQLGHIAEFVATRVFLSPHFNDEDTDSQRHRLEFRRINYAVWLQSIISGLDDLPQEACLDALDLSSISANTVVPLNTVLRELPGDRSSDLIAVRVPWGSDIAQVFRVKVELGPCTDKWGEDAAELSASWENGAAGTGKYEESSSLSVFESLQKASNLQHIKKWIHVPVWLAAEEPTKETCSEIEATGATLL